MRNRRSIPGIAALALSGLVVLGPVAATSAQASTKHHKTTTTTKKPKKSSSSGAISKTCPTGTAISTASGLTLPSAKTEKAAGSVICNYNTTTSGDNLVLSISPASGGTPADLKGAMEGQAKAQGVTAKSVSGFGTAAYETTLKDAAGNVDGQSTTILFILDHSTYIDITADAPASGVEAVGHYVLSH